MPQLRTVVERVAALVLWLVTVGLGIADIYFVREIFFAIFARFSTDGRTAALLGDLLVMVCAIVLVGFVVATAEYHRKRLGKRESWKLFIWTLGVELAIVLIVFLIG